MSPINEVSVLRDYGLTLDHFYSLVKPQLGNLTANQYIQLQASAVPFDGSLDYPWFSMGNLNYFFDTRLDPTPVADNLAMIMGARLSREYGNFLSDALSLVEAKELDDEIQQKIDRLEVEIQNLEEKISAKGALRWRNWVSYCENTMKSPADTVLFEHWSQGQALTSQIYQLEQDAHKKVAFWTALRDRSYGTPEQREIAETFAAHISAGSRMRYPKFEDDLYGDEAKKFSVPYFAGLPDSDSGLYANRQIMTTTSSLTNIVSSGIGSISSKIAKFSSAKESIQEDWSANIGGGWGPFSVSANVSSHTAIQEDFSHTEEISVETRATMALPINASPWFNPGLFNNAIIRDNKDVFGRYLGPKGSLLYYPTHMIVARGMKLTFHSKQDWQYDYERDFKTGGGGSASFFGVSFGGSAKYSKHEKRQLVERRGHDLVLDDGEANIRIIGFIAVKNEVLSKSIGTLASRFVF